MKIYLCLKTISFVHIFKFWSVLALTYSFLADMLIKNSHWDAQTSKTTRSLEEIVSPPSDSSVAMSPPSNSARDILNFSDNALYSIKNLVRLISNLVTTHKWFINWNVLSLSWPSTPNHHFPSKLGQPRVTRPLVSGHPAANRSVPVHLGTGAGSPANNFSGLAPVRPVTTSSHFLVIFPSLFLECVNMSPI
jgi:hypothetical protein